MKRTLEGKDGGAGRVKFVNIAAVGYAPGENEGVSYDAAMSTIHAIRRDGTVVTGPVALRALYDAVGWGWVAAFMALPLVDVGVEWFYKFVAKYRLPLSGTLTAMRRVKMTDEGVEHCVDDEDECEATAW
jgi:predicted DCC family thiol-disulfide oxidoreductase YuxK